MSNLILFITSEAVQTVFVYALVILFGLWLSKIKVKGISFGIAYALFVGIIFKSIGFNLNHSHIELFKEFGLILFVYALGYQLGPSFFNSFKNIRALCRSAALNPCFFKIGSFLLIKIIISSIYLSR